MSIGLLGGIAALTTLPGSLSLLWLTAAGVCPRKRWSRGAPGRPLGKFVVLVPAHDEEGSIARCVRSLKAADAPFCPWEIVVVADNCGDATAARAREAGATVWERTDTQRRGKGFALQFAFERLRQDEKFSCVVVVDADSRVDANFLTACERGFRAGAQALQTRYLVLAPEASWRAGLMNVALMAFNVLRPRARERLGLSVGIAGNGWGMTRACLEKVPYQAESIVEDLEHHLSLVRAGIRVRFLEDTTVRADMPAQRTAADTQRARWEGGRLRMIQEQVPDLLRAACHGSPRLLEPALELMLLPLSLHVSLLGASLLIPFPPTQLYGVLGLGLVAGHVAAAMGVGGAGPAEWRAVRQVPQYLWWKSALLPRIVRAAAPDHAWVRTEREVSNVETGSQ